MKDFLEKLYRHFNSRQIDEVLEQLTDDVQWANGMEGGYVYGIEAVRQYWDRQFKQVNATVDPTAIERTDGRIVVQVHQVVRNLDGLLLADEVVQHVFYFKNGKIAEFHIGQ